MRSKTVSLSIHASLFDSINFLQITSYPVYSWRSVCHACKRLWEIPYNQVCFHRVISAWNFRSKRRSSNSIFDNSTKCDTRSISLVSGICIYCAVNVIRKGCHNYSRMEIINAGISFKIISYIFSQIFIIYACVYIIQFLIWWFLFSRGYKKDDKRQIDDACLTVH